MDVTTAFFTYLLLAAAVTSAVIATNKAPSAVRRLAAGFRHLCTLLALLGVLGLALVVLAPSVAVPTRTLLRIVGYLGWLVVGTGVSAAFLAMVQRKSDAKPTFAASLAVSTGLAIYTAFAFFGFEIGKAAHDAEMRQFFIGSGYPTWFMYAVMAAEIAGAVALLVRRTRLIAACWLGAVMVGAITTHARNGDPFSDSLDAVRMLILVACIATLEWRRRR